MIETTPELRALAALETLLEEVNQSPFIGELSIAELQTMMAADTIRFTYVDGELAGFGAWLVINNQWVEIGPFYMAKRFRGRGLGKQIMADVVAHLDSMGKNQYAVTRNPSVEGMLATMGFRKTAFWRLPPHVLRHVVQKLRPRKLWGFFRKAAPGRMVHLVKIRKDRGMRT